MNFSDLIAKGGAFFAKRKLSDIQKIYDAGSAAEKAAFKASVSGALVSPALLGADKTGASDSSAVFAAAKTSGVVLVIGAGETYSVTQSVSTGALLNAGGVINVSAGVTLIVGSVVGSESTPVFGGAGTASMSNHRYSVGWYVGATANEKWDRCRRAFVAYQQYAVKFPAIAEDDPAAVVINPTTETVSYKITAPLIFDDQENMATVDMSECSLAAVSAVSSVLLFSPTNKTENIQFVGGLQIYGQGLATYCIDIRGGARLHFNDDVYVSGSISHGIRAVTDVASIDELEFNGQIIGVACGGRVLDVEGTASSRFVIGGGFRKIFCNGFLSGSGADAVYRVAGLVRGFVAGDALENYYEPYVAPTRCVGLIQATPNGAPQTLQVGSNLALQSGVSTLIFEESGTPSEKVRVSIMGAQSSPGKTTGSYITMRHVGIASLCGQQLNWDAAAVKMLTVDNTCDDIRVSGVPVGRVAGTAQRLFLDGALFTIVTLAADTATQVDTKNTTMTGFVDIVCKDDGNASAKFGLRNGGALVSEYAGTSVATAAGNLTGTTGTAGKLNVSYYLGVLYVENRLGVSRTVLIRLIGH